MVQMDMDENFQLGSDDEICEPQPGKKRKNTSTSEETCEKRAKTFKQPTTAELNHLRETQNLFNSNIFRLQIEELLAELKIKPKHAKNFENWFVEFEKIVREIPEFENATLGGKNPGEISKLCRASRFFSGENEVGMSLLRPKTCQTFGNLAQIRRKIKFSASISLTIPKAVFHEKDFLNGKYLLKKTAYLNYLLHHLKPHKNLIKQITVANHLGNSLLPTLKLTPNFSEDAQITLFLQPEVATFKTARFTPAKNNVKKDLTNSHRFPLEKFATVGTPYYNSSLLFDITLEENQARIREILAELPNVQEGIKLIFVWLSQRKLNESFRGFSDEIAVYFMVYLIGKRKINKHMSSYQVCRIFWANLAQFSAAISLAETANDGGFAEFSEFPAVLLDWSGFHNVAAFLDRDILQTVKNEAKMAIHGLDNVKFNTFSALFTQKISPPVQFDAIIKINDAKGVQRLYESASDEDKFKYLFYGDILVSDVIVSNLRQGLTDRVTRVVPVAGDSPRFGLNLDPDTHANVITRGPKQFEPGSGNFKKFWGKHAELRRFKDTSICEAVYFGESSRTVQERRQIFKRIVDYVMDVKLGLKWEVNGAELESLLRLERVPVGVANEEASLRAKAAHTELAKVLRDLKLPLSITAVQCVSDVYSYTDVFPPLQTSARWTKKLMSSVHEDVMIVEEDVKKLSDFMAPIECVIQLAIHSKWPKTLEAFRAMKTIFLSEMSNLLRKEHNVKSVIGDDSLDVYFQGYAFRLFLYHPKEIALLKQDVTSDGMTYYKDTVDSLRLETQYDILPKIAGALNGLHQMYPSFGPSTCLAKRWLRSQLIDGGHVSDTVVNLLNASLYLAPEPHEVATLPQLAFLRFLRFFAEFDPKTQPIIVNFNDEIPKDILGEMETKFLQNRQSFANLHIMTPFDEGNSVFTKHRPTPDILNRLKILAGATFAHLSNRINDHGPLKYKGIFVPNLDGYNVTIHLKSSLNPRNYQQIVKDNVKSDVFPYDESVKNVPIIGFDPVQIYLNELRENYGDLALFFHDTYGGNSIRVLWTKKALETLDFKISNVGGRKISAGKLSLNVDSVVDDFQLLGDGLVEKIAKNSRNS